MMLRTISNVKVGEHVNNTTLELQQDLARSTPKQCVTLTHSVPSVQMYYALKTKLESCSDTWLQGFLQLDGLDSLLESLSQMSGNGFTCFSDAILQMDCLSCIRCVLNTNIGLDHFIANDVYTKKLVSALTSNETLPRRHVFEILSGMCVYSPIGYLRVLEGLFHVKSENDQLHRFTVVVNDLQGSENVAHKLSVLTFINTVINCTPEITERIRIRNEFIGLNLLDVLSYLRRSETDDGIQLQLQIFHERKVSDEESVNANNNLDFNSPQDLLDLIQSKVFGTPKMVNFVNILQDLLSIETVHADNSNKIWHSLDGLIHYIVHTLRGDSIDNIQSTIYKFPEQVGYLLDCITTYIDTIKGPDIVGTNLSSATGTLTEHESKLFNYKSTCIDDESAPNLLTRKTFNQRSSSRSHFDPASQKHLLCNSGLEKLSHSNSYNDSATQNKTVILRKNDCEGTNLKDSVSSITDETVVIRTNKNNSLQSDDVSNCSSSGNETNSSEEIQKPHQELETRSPSFYDNIEINGEMSSTFNISEEDSVNGLNYNTNKSKLYNYNQNKVGSKLAAFKCDILEEESLNFEECYRSMMGIDKMGSKPEVLEKNIAVGEDIKDSSVSKKLVNKILREEITPPTKVLPNLKWITLPDDAIVGREPCIWLPVLSEKEKLTVDLQALEQMFHALDTQKSQAVEEVVLLNANTRLKINLFLSRLDCGAEDLVQHLEEGNKLKLSLPMLKYLSRVIPSMEEINMLRGYTGPRLELGMAEQFVLLLSDIPDYNVLIDGHLVQAEFEVTVKRCKTSLLTMVDMSHVVLKSQSLKRVCHLVLQIGNILNYGTYNGDTAGFKVPTLLQLTDVKSVMPWKTMLHHVVQTVMDQDKQVLDFVKQLLPLETAATCSMEEIKSDISKLNNKLQCFMINLSRANTKLQTMFHIFIEDLKKEFKEIQQLTVDLRSLTDDLAEYFCEDLSRFNLQECFQCLLMFCKEIKRCQADIVCMSKIQKLQNKQNGDLMQKHLKNKLMALEFGQSAGASSSVLEEKVKVMEKMLEQLHKGNFNPCLKSAQVSPVKGAAHPLEMSCIPFEGSPLQLRQRLGTNHSDNVFLDTPELVCAGYESGESGGMTRSSTQKFLAISETCTAQTLQKDHMSHNPSQKGSQHHTSSPIHGDLAPSGQSGTLQRKLFPKLEVNENRFQERQIDVDGCKPTQRPKRQLQLPGRRGNHCRSRSDVTDSICVTNKWIEYEKIRSTDLQDTKKAPIAEPESTCNLSTLNLEAKGKFLTNQDLVRYNQDKVNTDKIAKEPDQAFNRFHKTRKSEKKSSVGGFFSRIGRAVLKPRNVYSDGDQHEGYAGHKSVKSVSSDKENVGAQPMSDDRFGLRDSKRYKSENNASKMSKFFQRGGLYRSSKMKKRQQQEQNA